MANIQELVIDKKKAEDWMQKNFSNRNLSKMHVNFLRSQMDRGEWVFAADPIRFSGKFERLIDGQHRLTAFIQSTMKEMRVLVVYGLDESVFDNMDTGKIRSAGDLLSSMGYDDANTLSSVIKMIKMVKQGLVGVRDAHGGGGLRRGKKGITNHEVNLFLQSNPKIVDVTRQGVRWYRSFPVLGKSEYGCFYFVFSEKDPDMAFEFLDSFAKGANLTESSPIFVLRKKMESNKISSTKMVAKMKQSLIIQAWNLYRQGKEAKQLRFNPGDDLPKII
jgi:hypothetical protein